jgi:hypothetical protein
MTTLTSGLCTMGDLSVSATVECVQAPKRSDVVPRHERTP